MKVLHVYGDDDYAVITFADVCKSNYKEAWAKADTEADNIWEFAEGCYAEAMQFPGTVSKKFIKFINDEKDYDATKHSDWFIVEGEV